MDRVLDVDRASGLVRVEAGITIRELSARARPSTGSRWRTSATSTCRRSPARSRPPTHGTGARLRNISAQVEALELVLADGCDARRARRATRPRACCAPRASALGSARRDRRGDAALRARVHAARRRRARRRSRRRSTRFDELRARQRPLRVLRLPARRHGAARARTTAPRSRPRPRSAHARLARGRRCSTNHAFGASAAPGARFPRAIPRINRLVTRARRQHRARRPQRPRSSPPAARALHRDGVRAARASTPPRRCGACSR